MLSKIAAIQPVVHFVPSIQPPDAWKADNIDSQELALHQAKEFEDEITDVKQETDESRYWIEDGLLFTFASLHKGAPCYMRLLLPQAYLQQVIDRCHTEVGNPATAKTLARIQENFVSPGMRKHVREYLSTCTYCRTLTPPDPRSTQGKDTNTTSTFPHLRHRPCQTFPLGSAWTHLSPRIY